jgi:hypothetical protein
MTQGIKTALHPVSDLAMATALPGIARQTDSDAEGQPDGKLQDR